MVFLNTTYKNNRRKWTTRITVLLFFVFLSSYGLTQILHAQSSDSVEAECKAIISGASQANLSDPNSKASQCRALLDLEAGIAEKQKQLDSQKGQSNSLTNDIKILKTQIDKSKLNIKAKGIVIQKLSGDITTKSKTIETLLEKIDKEKQSLAQLLKKTDENDRRTFLALVLSDNSLSDFYSDVDSFSSIKDGIRVSVDEIQGVKKSTEKEKESLETKQGQEEDAKVALEQAKKKVEQNQQEQTRLLNLSKQKESAYQKDLVTQRAKAAQIRARLFQLAGGSAAIPFGTAVQYAESASQKTGVNSAFLLAILTQESNLGSNVGKCYLTSEVSGSGINVNTGKTWPNLMKPSRDIKPFIAITDGLGMDPFKTVVSCPIASAGGYGGAMGPAQFIASTWQIVAPRVASALGIRTPNPWAPQDAFTASAFYLSDIGAKSSETRAACRYYGSGGSSCSYGRSVMKLKANIQDDIDYLKKYGVSNR